MIDGGKKKAINFIKALSLDRNYESKREDQEIKKTMNKK